MNVTAIHLNGLKASLGAQEQKMNELKHAVDQLVSVSFLQTLLKTAQSDAFKTEFSHGGRGEEVFNERLNQLLSDKVVQSPKFDMGDAIYSKMAQRFERQLGAQEYAQLKAGA